MAARRQSRQAKRRGKDKWKRSRDADARINFLWTAARTVADVSGPASRHLVWLMKKIAVRLNHRLDRDAVKRRVCRRCNAVLRPGTTATVRVRRRTIIVHCNACGSFRRFPAQCRRREAARSTAEVPKPAARSSAEPSR